MIRLLLLTVLVFHVNCALLGANKCTWGPSYWCTSFKTADECGATEHCRQKVWGTSLVALTGNVAPVKDSDACTFCKDMVADVKNFLEKNQTRDFILQYWKRACDFMPDQYSMQECMKIEQHYLDLFMQMVKDDIDPTTICTVASLCQNSTSESRPSKPVKISRVSLTKAASVSEVSDTPTCAACKAFMAILSNEVKDPKNQDMVKNLMMQECKQLGGNLVQECQSLITSYLPEVFTLLEQELSDNLCKLATLCPTTSTASLATATRSRIDKWFKSSSLRSQLASASARLGSETCDLCEKAVGFAKIFLSNNNTEQEVAQMLENDVCSALGQYSSMCSSAVEQYLPMVWSEILGYLDPATLCTDLGLCTKAASKPAPKPRAKASPTCLICEFVMSKLESMLADNATESEVIDAVEKVCSILPQTVRSECDSLIEKYGPAIIHLLVHEASPSVICGFLGVCATGDNLYKAPLKDVKADNCMMCELAMSYVQSMLKKNSTEEEIQEVLEKVCHFLSGSMAQECNTMIETYAPQILKMLADRINPKDICTRLGMCNSVKVDGLVHLLRVSDNS